MLQYSFVRYLTAKKTIDDRALNQAVWDAMVQMVVPEAREQPIRIIEIGCGIGTMLDRLVERELGTLQTKKSPRPKATNLPRLDYTGIDADSKNITHAQKRFAKSLDTNPQSPISNHQSAISNPQSPSFIHADLFSLPPALPKKSFDLLIAHAFLDLVDISRALPILFSCLRPGGVFYFTLNFDGETIFQPEHPLDSKIISLYHQTMDERQVDGIRSGNRYTGRHLFGYLKDAGATLLAAGSSDWVVYSGADGYPDDETYFLHHILHFFEQSLDNHPGLEEKQLDTWLAVRHAQIERGELVYLAHQLDFVGKI